MNRFFIKETYIFVFGEMQIKIKRNFVTVDNGQL